MKANKKNSILEEIVLTPAIGKQIPYGVDVLSAKGMTFYLFNTQGGKITEGMFSFWETDADKQRN